MSSNNKEDLSAVKEEAIARNEEIRNYLLEFEAMEQRLKKARRKLQFTFTFISIYLISLFVAIICGIVFPSFKRTTDIYLVFGNGISIVICIYAIFTMFKAETIKLTVGKFLLVACSISIMFNLMVIVFNVNRLF